MSIVERDEVRSQLQARDDLRDPRLRAVVNPSETHICFDDPTSDNADEWLQSDHRLDTEVVR